ncbi:TPA: excinuclease ABC subunit C [Candidatus Dependentiae bacterium]|nr:MAG: UvrABC system protein C [candidate division TM6 bacterium GW2011_GWE2_31_21]KKP53272.1 MAG: UvrABC system protein C [candidate division TM6 bacterium GW2011_GWF2_33_332]HBS48028.1 excinuclease ABC subunit C [Candidatus Dependentiae bacterium]HBZ73368.1 excinuclease ABC subunit C [Candidatus Dependentiae bacterium]
MKNVKDFPSSPGVYIHKDVQGDIIYVGKAKNLRKRIASYFNESRLDPKTTILVSNIKSTDYIITNNELEALLLENQLIKKHRPKYNIQLKDAAKYFYIKITKEDFPQVLVARKTNKKDIFFGPYTSSIRGFTKILRDYFKIRSCGFIMPKKSCLYKDLGICSAPCVGKISKEDYKKIIDDVIHFIRHGDESLLSEYQERMETHSKNLEFEKALEFRNKINLLHRLLQKQCVDLIHRSDTDAIGIATINNKSYISVLSTKNGVLLEKNNFTFLTSDDILSEFLKIYYTRYPAPDEIIIDGEFDSAIENYLQEIWNKKVTISNAKYGRKLELITLAKKNAYTQINCQDNCSIEIKEMLALATIPHIIDCFDISNFGEDVIVGGCVQFKGTQPNKSQYQYFNIKGDFGQDDFRSIHEVVKRRYAKYSLPDLLLIDGGSIQVDFAQKALKELKLNCPVIGLAKKEETIIFPDGKSLRLNLKKDGAKLLIKIRDSVHNFVIAQSRKVFKKSYKHSALDDIVGIGESTKFKLLQCFGSVEAVQKTNLEQLTDCIGKSRAEVVYKFFH